jgi:peptide/nickel transport system permease protein
MARSSLLRRSLKHKSILVGGFIIFTMLTIAITSKWIAPYEPNAINPRERLKGISSQHFWGTDHLGRDIFSRVIFGTQLSVLVGGSVSFLVIVVGCAVGLLAGYLTKFDNIIMRVMDGLMAFPPILLALAIMGAMGTGVFNVIFAISIVMIPRMSRVVRSITLEIREEIFVEAARAIGGGDMYIVVSHIFPNCLHGLAVQATYTFALAVLVEASLSFLGVGPPPSIPSWGNILAETRPFILSYPWMPFLPGVFIVFTVLGLNLFGDGLRDILDPRL